MIAQAEPLCPYSGRTAPNVMLDEKGRIICGCERRIRVRRGGHIARHRALPLLREEAAAAAGPPPVCWADRGQCGGRVLARGLCGMHYRRLLRLNLGASARPGAIWKGAIYAIG